MNAPWEVLGLLSVVVLTGCGSYRSVVLKEHRVENSGLYEFDRPDNGGSWQWRESDQRHYGEVGFSANDVLFVDCSGPKHIMVSRAKYRRPGRKEDLPEGVPEDSFQGVAVWFLTEFYKKMGVSEARFSEVNTSSVADSEAAEVLVETREGYPESCEPGFKNVERKLLNKFIVVKRGDWAYTKMSPKGTFPNMIVFWYGSPEEYFKEGLDEFDRVVKSFRLVQR